MASTVFGCVSGPLGAGEAEKGDIAANGDKMRSKMLSPPSSIFFAFLVGTESCKKRHRVTDILSSEPLLRHS